MNVRHHPNQPICHRHGTFKHRSFDLIQNEVLSQHSQVLGHWFNASQFSSRELSAKKDSRVSCIGPQIQNRLRHKRQVEVVIPMVEHFAKDKLVTTVVVSQDCLDCTYRRWVPEGDG